MTEPVATWAGCLVLVVAPAPLSATAAEAVLQVERMIYNDPVYIDATRVSSSDVAEPLSGELDTVAFTLYRELVVWGASPARNPAPRATFCVLLVHPNQQEADRLVNALANSPQLSELPIIFRTAEVADPGTEDRDVVPELVTHVKEAIDATAREIDRDAEFSLDVDQLSRMAVNTPLVPSPPPSSSPAPEQQFPEPPPEHSVVPARITEEPAPVEPPDPELPTLAAILLPGKKNRLSLADLVPDAIRHRSQEVIARRNLPSSGVDVIKELSDHTSRVILLYMVFASEPLKPSRGKRRARTEFACALTRLLLAEAVDRDPWYVRTFSAGRKLLPGRPVTDPELVRHRDFPDQWGQHFDLFDIVGAISDAAERDRSSFRRRGVEPARTAVVFIAGSVPHICEDTRTRLTALCSTATVTWVSFEPVSTEKDEERFESAGVQVFEHHEDLVDELLRAVDPPLPPPAEAELTAVSAEPSPQSEE